MSSSFRALENVRGRILLAGFGVDGQQPDQTFSELVVLNDPHACAFALALARPPNFANTTGTGNDISCLQVLCKPNSKLSTLIFGPVVRPKPGENWGLDERVHGRDHTAAPYVPQGCLFGATRAFVPRFALPSPRGRWDFPVVQGQSRRGRRSYGVVVRLPALIAAGAPLLQWGIACRRPALGPMGWVPGATSGANRGGGAAPTMGHRL